MAIYEYRCASDGAFDVTLPIGTAPASLACPACEGLSLRVFTNPMTRSAMPRELVSALNTEERTRHAPDVVTSIPPSGQRRPARMARMTPQLAKLPRP